MTRPLVCPKCRSSFARPGSSGVSAQCPVCGARVSPKLATAAPKAAPPSPDEPKPKKRKKAKKPAALSMGMIVGLSAGALVTGVVLVCGIIGLVVLGSSKPGGGGTDVAGEMVVVDSPPAGAAPATSGPAAITPPPPPEKNNMQPTGPSRLQRPQGDPPKRPAATPLVRDGVAPKKPEPPADWAVPPAAAPGPSIPVGVTIPDRLLAMADSEAAAVRFTPPGEKRDQLPGLVPYSMAWVRYDRKTGQPLGEPIPLWPPAPKYWFDAYERDHPFSVALTVDGQQLALRDPTEPCRVDVWDSGGKRLLGMEPYPNYPVEGVAWSVDGRLLTVGQGKLTAWEVPAGKAVFEIDGQYAGPIHLEPGRRWLVVATYPGHVDVLATDSGDCLGRCAEDNFGYRWANTLLSPDGSRLVRTLQGGRLSVWDLKTGQLTARVPVDSGGLVWCDGRRFLATQGVQERKLLDLDSAEVACELEFDKSQVRSHMPELQVEMYLVNDPAGGVWASVPADAEPKSRKINWRRTEAPTVGQDAVAFGPGTTVRLEVNLGDTAKSRNCAQMLAGQLHARGLKIGPGGWVLRGETQAQSTGSPLSDLSSGEISSVRIMSLTTVWRLLTPDGAEAWKGSDGIVFDPAHSRYTDKRKSHIDFGPGGGSTVALDFGGRDPKEAMVEELREKYLGPNGLPNNFPARLVKTAEGYTAAAKKVRFNVGP